MIPPLVRGRVACPVAGRLAAVLAGVFLFNVGASGWTAAVAGRLAQGGEGTALLGALYAACEVVRLPAALLLPALTLRLGARRVAQAGLLALATLPLLALGGLDTQRLMLSLVLAALPSMAVYVGLPVFVLGATGAGRDGWALACLGIAGGAGGAVGPWLGGYLADDYGLLPVLGLFAAGSALLLPIVSRGRVPPPTPWQGWAALAHRGLPWQALAALALASAADAGRATLVPAELVRHGLPLADTGFLLGVGAALAGTGFLLFGRLADRQSPGRVVGAGLGVLVAGSFALVLSADWSPAYALSSAVLGMGASGVRLGAAVALTAWLGSDRAAVAAALGETTVLGGRALGAPAVGALSDTYGGGYAFGAIGSASLFTAALLVLASRARWRTWALAALPTRRISG